MHEPLRDPLRDPRQPKQRSDSRGFANALRATLDTHLRRESFDRTAVRELVEWTELIASSIEMHVQSLALLDEREGLELWLRLTAFVESLLLELGDSDDAGDLESGQLSRRIAFAARRIGSVSFAATKRRGARA